MPYTVYTLQRVHCLHTVGSSLCMLNSVYDLHCICSTLCTLDTVYTLHSVYSILCTLYRVYALHSVRSTQCTLYCFTTLKLLTQKNSYAVYIKLCIVKNIHCSVIVKNTCIMWSLHICTYNLLRSCLHLYIVVQCSDVLQHIAVLPSASVGSCSGYQQCADPNTGLQLSNTCVPLPRWHKAIFMEY